MKVSDFFKKFKKGETKRSFSEFFLHASAEEKERVFTDAARRANEDQRALLKSVQHKAS